MSMLGNYFKIAIRSLVRHKTYSVINIAGLAVGMAACIIILLWVRFHLSFDDFHANSDRIFLLYEVQNFSGLGEQVVTSTMGPMGQALKNDYPDVEGYTRLMNDAGFATRYADKPAYLRMVYYADSSFFNFFSFRLQRGDPHSALIEPNSIVLTRKSAEMIFGADNPLGKVLRREQEDYIVTGVMEDFPSNSTIQPDILISFSSVGNNTGHYVNQWGSNSLLTFLKLFKGTDYRGLEKKLGGFVQKYLSDSAAYYQMFLLPMNDLHLRFGNSLDLNYLIILAGIGIIVLIQACINYMTLAVARSARRAREVGLRKVLGAAQRQLIRQFLFESVFLSFSAILLAIVLIELALPQLNVFFGNVLVFDYVSDWKSSLGLIVLTLAVGLGAGSYPAFIISSFRPCAALKGTHTSRGRGSLLRQTLVVAQFAVSITLVVCTLFAVKQMKYLRNMDLGFDKEQVAVLPMNWDMAHSFENVQEELLQYRGITAVTATDRQLGNLHNQKHFKYEGQNPTSNNQWITPVLTVDYGFIPFFGLEMVAGRNFSEEFSTDAGSAFIINETMAKKIGWTALSAVGKKFSTDGIHFGNVIGVVNDFHFNSLHYQIEPLVLTIDPQAMRTAYVKMNPEKTSEVLKFLKEKWDGYIPDRPFEFSFMDEDFARLYQTDRQKGLIFGAFSMLAVFIACLGLLGLISCAAESRTKEIGIRKVLGASVPQIVLLLSKEFLLLLGIAVLVAWPAAWYVMNRWLQNFAYRIELDWWTFALAGLMALAVAAATVSFQAVRAATADPVESLRYE